MPALILMYHNLAVKEADLACLPAGHRPYVLDILTFQNQMETVASEGFPLCTVRDWGAPSHPQRTIVLTFDDGHVSNHDVAFPILLKNKLKATFFITAGLIGVQETMNWAQIRTLHEAGMEIGSHTLTHRPPSTLTDEELRHELVKSRCILEDGLGAPVTSISSPTGFFNPRMCAIAKESGYHALCFGRVGLAADAGDPFSLKRVAVKRGMNEEEFKALLRFDGSLIRRIRLQQFVRELGRKILRPTLYLQIRKILMERVFVR
jgi:peptidoglycan/xylan/chitin deacetylase (PgdA/CDA1 family)